PDASLLAVGSAEGTVNLWNTALGKQISMLQGKMGVPTAIAFSPNMRFLAVASPDSVAVWNVATNRQIASFYAAGAIDALSFTPDGTYVTGVVGKEIRSWPLEGTSKK